MREEVDTGARGVLLSIETHLLIFFRSCSAIGDADCAAFNPSGVFPNSNGIDCRYAVWGGGGGASHVNSAGNDDNGGVQGNSARPIPGGNQLTSAGIRGT